ncbi:MAG: ribonuclease Z [Bacteroidaceae bacterium]|nr:ribonuclease Z [Bacteroidaceae bacterium]MBQ5617498.1 ribonuclease Z [Bacteroidaceae bacterium]
MEAFEIHILGCGSALPTTRHNASSQVIRIGNKQFMIDCGEGTQLQLRRNHIHFSFINHIFISHLHGDHSFGLIGLISTFGLLGRTAPLHIYADAMLEKVMKPQLDFYCKDIKYPLFFHSIDASKHSVIYEDNTITVETLPLNHRMPCCGFLFREKPKRRHLIGDVANFYNIPIYQRQSIKDGADYTTPDGTVIPNSKLTREADPSRSYAYCSDTRPCPQICGYLKDVDLLYHEATFAESEKERAKVTHHSTAKEAAEIALTAGVKRLLLGHYSSRYDDEKQLLSEASEIFPVTECANEGMVIKI